MYACIRRIHTRCLPGMSIIYSARYVSASVRDVLYTSGTTVVVVYSYIARVAVGCWAWLGERQRQLVL